MEMMIAAAVTTPSLLKNHDKVAWPLPALAHRDNDDVHAVLKFCNRFLLLIFLKSYHLSNRW